MFVGLGLVQACPFEFIGHELQVGKMARKVMGVFVSVGIAQFFHQLRGRIAKIERNGRHLRLIRHGKGGVHGQVGRVALGR